ncbi:hypothetical protein [Corynebacterium sp.]|uniref:hypothetical protein n=1 Tax=Corynebacterium sp. TaxID=1720 RepID=UPI0025B82AA9|nr:hypothetical protein [Corynebacterium sp.]
MSDTEKKTNWNDPKVRRKALYAGAVTLGVILAGIGLNDPDQIDSTVQRVLDVGGPLLSLVGIKAFRNVDAPSQEVEAARAKAREEAKSEALAEARAEAEKMLAQVREEARTSANQVGDILAAKLDELPDYLRPSVSDAVRAVYDQPYGRHDAAAPEPEPDTAGPGIYPGGAV